MSDLIIKTFEDFQHVKETLVLSEELREKYRKNLFEKYECFSSAITVNATQHTKKGPPEYRFKGVVKRKPAHVSHESLDTTPRNLPPKSLHRTIMGILNIINESNYAKNLTKIRLLSTEGNIRTIVKEIMHKCCIQAFYLGTHFVKLLKDMITLSGYAEIIRDEIMKFVETFMQSDVDYYFHKARQENETEYDHFCNEQKHKVYALAKNNLVIALIKEGIVPIDINEYFIYFTKEIQRCHESDVIIQILIDIVKIQRQEIHKELLMDLYRQLNLENYDNEKHKKIGFMIEELQILLLFNHNM